MNEMKSNSDQIFSMFFFLCVSFCKLSFTKIYHFDLCYSFTRFGMFQFRSQTTSVKWTNWTKRNMNMENDTFTSQTQDSINVWNLCTQKLLGKWETLAKEINVIVDRNIVRMPNKLFARSPFLHVFMRSRGRSSLLRMVPMTEFSR